MKIAFAVPAYWPSVIGVSLYCQELAEALVKRGHEVTVHAGLQPGWPTAEERNGVKIRRYHRKHFGDSFYTLPSMAKAICLSEPDVIHSHHYGYMEATAGLQAAQKLGKPHVFGPYYHPPIYGPVKKVLSKAYHWRYGKPLLEHSERILPHTKVEEKMLVQAGGKLEAMRILPNTVDTKFFKPVGKKEKMILFVSNLITEKGAGVALSLANQISKERKGVKFIFRGMPYDKHVIEKIEEVADNKNIEFIFETISPKDLAKLYSRATAIILPSKYEAFSKVLAEAQSCGTPVVATKVGGIPEVVQNGKTGFLVEYGDWDEMKDKITLLLNKPQLVKKMGSAGRKHITENYDTKNIVDRLEAIYEELV